MPNEITNKTWVILLGGGYKTYITENEASFFNMAEKGTQVVLKDGRVIRDWIAVIPVSEVNRDEKIKRGDWQCVKCNRWHPRGEQCGCQGGRY